MNDKEQIIAMAESTGWRSLTVKQDQIVGLPPHVNSVQSVPNFLTDWIATNKAIEDLDSLVKKQLFALRLWRIVSEENIADEHGRVNYSVLYEIANASTPQRVQAYLQVAGKWK